MKSSRARPAQAGGANIQEPLIVTTSSTFTPNSYPFKYKLYLLGAGSNSAGGYATSGTNVDRFYYASGGGSGKFYVSSSTETLTSGSLVFAIGASASSANKSLGGSTTVTRTDNSAVVGAYNTNYALPAEGGGAGSGGSGGGAGGYYNVSNNTGATNFTPYTAGYAGYYGGQGTSGGNGAGGAGDSNTGGAQAGNDTRIPRGGNGTGQTPSVGTAPPNYAGIVIGTTTYLAGTTYGQGGEGGGSPNQYFTATAPFSPGGPGVAILEPIP